MPTPSPSQQAYWNGAAGNIWSTEQERLDAMLEPVNAAVLDALKAEPGAKILDVGCGAGVTTLALAARGYRPTGVDISTALLVRARERAAAEGAEIAFIEADAGAAAIPGAPFGGLFSRFGVMFFEAPQDAFAHLRAQLTPGAPLAFICWRAPADNAWNLLSAKIAQSMIETPLPKPDPHAPGPMAFADAERTRGILTGAGWRDAAIKPWDGHIFLGGTIPEAADLLTLMAKSRLIDPYGLDPARISARIAEEIAPMASAEGVLAPAGCWIVTARA